MAGPTTADFNKAQVGNFSKMVTGTVWNAGSQVVNGGIDLGTSWSRSSPESFQLFFAGIMAIVGFAGTRAMTGSTLMGFAGAVLAFFGTGEGISAYQNSGTPFQQKEDGSVGKPDGTSLKIAGYTKLGDENVAVIERLTPQNGGNKLVRSFYTSGQLGELIGSTDDPIERGKYVEANNELTKLTVGSMMEPVGKFTEGRPLNDNNEIVLTDPQPVPRAPRATGISAPPPGAGYTPPPA